MQRIAPKKSDLELRKFLGGFAFSNDMAINPIDNFSGGEKARLALALIVWHAPNILILDEPTNHLDIASKNVLKEALKKFEGTLIVVSHDRDFLQGLTTTVYGFKDKVIKEYLGDIDYFLEQHKMESMREAEKRTIVKSDRSNTKKESNQLDRAQEKELKKLIVQMELVCRYPQDPKHQLRLQ